MNSLADTARWAAAQRARESERPDRLFEDPLARELAGEAGMTMLRLSEQHNPYSDKIADYLAVRTRFFDDFLLEATRAGLRQAVLVAAGMDTRAFRLELPPGMAVFELDQGAVLDLKEEVLGRLQPAPRCHRTVLRVDLQQDWAPILKDAGFQPAAPSLWILEGLLFYFEEHAVRRLFTAISGLAAAGSRAGAEFVGQSYIESPWMQEALRSMKERGTPWLFGTDEPEAMLAEYGWRAEAIQPGEEGAHFGRSFWPVAPRDQKQFPHSYLVRATKTYGVSMVLVAAALWGNLSRL